MHIGANFRGFVEGHDITAGTTDVIVTDGFTGNVALKTGEGALKLMRDLLRQVFTSTVPARLGYLLARPALDRLREWMDPRRYNGAILIGLNGVVVKSHGGTDALGFAHAVDVAMDMVTHGFNESIRDGLTRLSTTGPRIAADSSLRLPPSMVLRAIIAGCGGYLPATRLSNDELAALKGLDTSDAWIRERTGIGYRHFAAPDETASDMGAAAARQALERAGVDASEVDAVLVATSTPDSAFPATAARIQAKLGVTKGFAFDLAAACTGFIYGVGIADAFIRTGQARCVLVIGTEVYSRILDWTDRGTCVLFGDGAGAMLLRAGEGRAPPPIAACCPATCIPMAAWATSCISKAAPGPPAGRACCAWRARKCSATPSPSSPPWWMRRWPPMASAMRMCAGWCRTRPIAASSMPWARSCISRPNAWS